MLIDSIKAQTAITLGLEEPLDSTITALAEKMDGEELWRLPTHSHPKVKARSLLFILERADSLTSAQALRLLATNWQVEDTVHIYTYGQEGQQLSKVELAVGRLYGEWLANIGSNSFYYLPDYCRRFANTKLFDSQLDSFVLHSPAPWRDDIFWLAMRQDSLPESWYPGLRELAAKKDLSALVALAHYQREQDVPILIAGLPTEPQRQRLVPYRFFQHPDIFRALAEQRRVFATDRSYLALLVQYADTAAVNVLTQLYEDALAEPRNKFALAQIELAISQNYSPVFTELYVRWLSECGQTGVSQLPAALWPEHGDTLLHFYRQWLHHELPWVHRRAKQCFQEALVFVAQAHPEQLTKLMLNQLSAGSQYRDYMQSLVYIYRHKDKAFIDPLFALLAQETAAENRFLLAKLLTSYADAETHTRLEAFFRTQPEQALTVEAAVAGGRVWQDLLYYAKREE
jgi:hypothetical protein